MPDVRVAVSAEFTIQGDNIMSNFKRDSILVILIILVFAVIASITSCSASRTVNMPIVLLTDFGAEDYRISQLKGIIMNNNREARIIDASHSVPAFDIATGAFMLDTAAKEFPENVVFISVIAPYDQTDTKYFVLTTNKNQFFLLPDNGLSTHVIKQNGCQEHLSHYEQKLFKKPIKNLSA
jgi:S-adenosylmethionine hydrolase